MKGIGNIILKQYFYNKIYFMKHILSSILQIVFLNSAINAQITSTDWYNKGLKLNDSSKFTLAINAFEKAILLDANFAEAYYRLGWTYDELEAYDKAIEKLSKAILLKTDYAFALQEMGYAYYKKSDYTKAVNYLNKSIAAKPDYSMAYKVLGDVNLQIKKDVEAISNYEKAYSFDNKNSGACYELGYCYNNNNNFEKALEWLNKGIEVKPTADIYSEIGYAYSNLNKGDEAIAAYQNSLQLSPQNSTAYKGMGDVYRLNYNPAKTIDAKENYKLAVKYNTQNSGAYYGLGWCYNELNNFDSSIINLKKEIELDKTVASVYTELGYAQYMKGYLVDGLNSFNKVLELDGKATLPLYYKGYIYVAQKDKSNATAMYNQLKPLDDDLAAKLLIKINTLQ